MSNYRASSSLGGRSNSTRRRGGAGDDLAPQGIAPWIKEKYPKFYNLLEKMSYTHLLHKPRTHLTVLVPTDAIINDLKKSLSGS